MTYYLDYVSYRFIPVDTKTLLHVCAGYLNLRSVRMHGVIFNIITTLSSAIMNEVHVQDRALWNAGIRNRGLKDSGVFVIKNRSKYYENNYNKKACC